MNPGAIQLYADHEIDITIEPLEIAVCAQHNNGGLAANHWWESVNVKHLFPVGEVNGSHGAYRPGGSALNSGQVGAFRAAEYIAARYREKTAPEDLFGAEAEAAIERLGSSISEPGSAARSWREELDELQNRMTSAAAHIREPGRLRSAVAEAGEQWAPPPHPRLQRHRPGRNRRGPQNPLPLLHSPRLPGSRPLLARKRCRQPRLGRRPRPRGTEDPRPARRFPGECSPKTKPSAKSSKRRSSAMTGGSNTRWAKRRPIPESDTWFETAWAKFRDGEIYDGEPGEA